MAYFNVLSITRSGIIPHETLVSEMQHTGKAKFPAAAVLKRAENASRKS